MRWLNAGLGIFTPSVVAIVAPAHRVLASLLVHEHEVDDHTRAVGPLEIGRPTAVANQVSLTYSLGNHG
jgi:hypothetical protein